MAFVEGKNSVFEDSETGFTLRRGGAADIDMSSFFFFDPSNSIKLWKHSRPGEVKLSAFFIYAAPPIQKEDGRLKWAPVVGYRVLAQLIPFYAHQLGLKAQAPEVIEKVLFARAKIAEALTVIWRSDRKNIRDPIIDTDGSHAREVKLPNGNTCLIPN